MGNQNQTIAEIKEFVSNYISQSNRMTAWPYAYVIQQKEIISAWEGCGDLIIYCCREHEYFDYDNEEELRNILIENDYEDAEIESFDAKVTWEDQQWFFTKEEAEIHLKRNGHNYQETRLYVKHLFRHNEAEMILHHLFSVAGEDYDKYKR